MKRKPTRETNGKVGETLAEIWFAQNKWIMFRHQPPTRTISIKGRPITIQCKSDGTPDYTGYEDIQIAANIAAIYRAVEVKEAYGETMSASRLSIDQRRWMCKVNPKSAYVMICWMDHNPHCELFRFISSGSYKKGCGLK